MKVKIKPVPWLKPSPTEAVAAFKRGEMFFTPNNEPVNRTVIPVGTTVVIVCREEEIEVINEQV